MESETYIKDYEIKAALIEFRFQCGIDEGRLKLLELLCKAGAGSYNSVTEEGFLNKFKVTRKDRTPNKLGRLFICSMIYMHSNNQPEAFGLMQKFRI